MTIIAAPLLIDQQHLVLDAVSWEFYERVLDEVADRLLRITFHQGRMEIMPPLPEQEFAKTAVGGLVEIVALEWNIPMRRFGSATFRREDTQGGLEPDECYYLANEDKVRGMKRFDPAIHPAPDLAIEIDITRRSVPRQPIYAGLGVPELWRYNGKRLTILLLEDDGTYIPSVNSPSFPKLPMDQFEQFVHRMESDEEQTSVLRAFRDWIRALPTP
ncbi:MAG TPA: Uma2 family endonuclease [Tepidisphaeraceae bacterium]|nr:Uma2 family endonuclease [Tepidisphaeraceae bacterium]